jgi:hypothetical protein
MRLMRDSEITPCVDHADMNKNTFFSYLSSSSSRSLLGPSVPLPFHASSQGHHVLLHAAVDGDRLEPDRSTRRPRRRLKLHPAELTPVPLPSHLPPKEEDMQALDALFDKLDDEGKLRASALTESSGAALLRERLAGLDDGQLRAYVDAVMSKWVNPSFWDATLVQPLALDVVRERLGPAHSALLGKIMVRNESTGDVGTGLNTNRPGQLGRWGMRLLLLGAFLILDVSAWLDNNAMLGADVRGRPSICTVLCCPCVLPLRAALERKAVRLPSIGDRICSCLVDWICSCLVVSLSSQSLATTSKL